jgi:heme/copper-type cytochrome/quinol oxidase subunit 3
MYGMPVWRAIGTIALFCGIGSIVCALTYIAVMHANLPATDLASHETLLDTLCDPFVVVVALVWSLVSSALVFPFAVLLLRQRKIAPTFLIVLATTLLAIAVVTPRSARFGWLGSYCVVVIALIACRFVPLLAIEHRELRS